MAKLVSRVRRNQNEAAQQQSRERGGAANSSLNTVFGAFLVLLLIMGAIYVALSAMQM